MEDFEEESFRRAKVYPGWFYYINDMFLFAFLVDSVTSRAVHNKVSLSS